MLRDNDTMIGAESVPRGPLGEEEEVTKTSFFLFFFWGGQKGLPLVLCKFYAGARVPHSSTAERRFIFSTLSTHTYTYTFIHKYTNIFTHTHKRFYIHLFIEKNIYTHILGVLWNVKGRWYTYFNLNRSGYRVFLLIRK